MNIGKRIGWDRKRKRETKKDNNNGLSWIQMQQSIYNIEAVQSDREDTWREKVKNKRKKNAHIYIYKLNNNSGAMRKKTDPMVAIDLQFSRKTLRLTAL